LLLALLWLTLEEVLLIVPDLSNLIKPTKISVIKQNL
jgi:hypothetical protein